MRGATSGRFSATHVPSDARGNKAGFIPVRCNHAMAEIRPLAQGDIGELARLFARVHPRAQRASQSECEAYFHHVFFANPWVDAELPSWLAWEGSQAVGFIGVVPRPMRLRGRALRAAVVTQLMVHPEKRHGLAAAQLLRKALAGPQDLTLSDGANDASRRMWEALGGLTSTLYSLEWRRQLRPARAALERAARLAGRSTAFLGAPFAALADALTARRRALRSPSRLREEPLDAASLLTALDQAAARVALAPSYDARSLEWLLVEARAKRRHGELQARLLRDAAGELAGWFLYYANGGASKVLQLHAREGAEHLVIHHLLRDAWRRGSIAIEGRMEPRLARALGESHCVFHAAGAYALVHARDAGVLSALAGGDAFFSRLEGEWWMRFLCEPPRARGFSLALPDFLWRPRQQPALN